MNRVKSLHFDFKNETPVNYDLSPFMPQNMSRSATTAFQNESTETLREKLLIKSEALNLLGKQLELCNREKSEYKRLIDTLYDKNLALKKSLYFKQNASDPTTSGGGDADDAEFDSFFQPAIGLSSATHAPASSARFAAGRLFAGSGAKSSRTPPLVSSHNVSPNNSSTALFNDIDSEDYVKILKDLIRTLQKEKLDVAQKYEDARQELGDARSDLRLLREQIVRQRVGSCNEGLTTSIRLEGDALAALSSAAAANSTLLACSAMTTNASGAATAAAAASIANNSPTSSCTSASAARATLIKEIELAREQRRQVDEELRLVICQKEEVEMERDAYKEKFARLNEFLISSGSGSSEATADSAASVATAKLRLSVDELLSQNKYLNESNRSLKDELDISRSTLKKYKQLVQQQQQSSSSSSSSAFSGLSSSGGSGGGGNVSSDMGVVNKMQLKELLCRAEQFLDECGQRQAELTAAAAASASGTFSASESDSSHFLSAAALPGAREYVSLLDSVRELTGSLRLALDTLLENLNDKLVANQHQRRVNKMLATRIQDLERQIAVYATEMQQQLTNAAATDSASTTAQNDSVVASSSSQQPLSTEVNNSIALMPLTPPPPPTTAKRPLGDETLQQQQHQQQQSPFSSIANVVLRQQPLVPERVVTTAADSNNFTYRD